MGARRCDDVFASTRRVVGLLATDVYATGAGRLSLAHWSLVGVNKLGSLTGSATVCNIDDVMKHFLGCLLIPVCAVSVPTSAKKCNVVAGVCTVATLLLMLLAYNVRAKFFHFTGGNKRSPIGICSAALLAMKTVSLSFLTMYLLFLRPVTKMVKCRRRP